MKLRRFQHAFLASVLNDPSVKTAALSMPRGNGKSFLGGIIVARHLIPPIRFPGREFLILAASMDQSRHVFHTLRRVLHDHPDYRWQDSYTQVGVKHLPTGTTARVISSNAKTAFGIVGCPLAIADEPGSWQVTGGRLMYDALQTAMGKPQSALKVIYLGTLAPAEGGWWHDLVRGGGGPSTHVTLYQGDAETWDNWHTIRKANPLVDGHKEFRQTLLRERDEARTDPAAKARFLSYRLNIPSADESSILLTVDDWQRVCAREITEREGLPVVGVDLGASRAWTAAVAQWRSGRVEALAITPGYPSIDDQERRDRVPRGTYRHLVEDGLLRVAEGYRVVPPEMLVEAVRDAWGEVLGIVGDRFREGEIRDALAQAGYWVDFAPRRTRWSESSEDIRALRRMALDGSLSVPRAYRPLLAASLARARVLHDNEGNMRLVKGATDNSSRDDVVSAWVLCAGAISRLPAEVPYRAVFV